MFFPWSACTEAFIVCVFRTAAATSLPDGIRGPVIVLVRMLSEGWRRFPALDFSFFHLFGTTGPPGRPRNNHPKMPAAHLGCAIAASPLSTIGRRVAIAVTHKFVDQLPRKFD
jgi:hypothetical protein